MNHRDRAIDGLRGFAVLAVVACHISKLCKVWGISTFEVWAGGCGAHLLLVISGFAMAAVLSRTHGLYEFLFGRFTKIYPTYALSILISAVAITLYHPPTYDVSANQVLASPGSRRYRR